jgi:hypothetical protein
VGLVSRWYPLHSTKKSIDSKKKGLSSLWAVRNPGFCSSLVNFNCSVHGRNWASRWPPWLHRPEFYSVSACVSKWLHIKQVFTCEIFSFFNTIFYKKLKLQNVMKKSHKIGFSPTHINLYFICIEISQTLQWIISFTRLWKLNY